MEDACIGLSLSLLYIYSEKHAEIIDKYYNRKKLEKTQGLTMCLYL
jgi:hypothetical protein